jgi:hypothetical protein
MPFKISAEALRKSAKGALSPVPPPGGSRSDDRQYAWDRFRSGAAQACLADPDILPYLKLRKLRSLSRPLAELHGLICTAMELTEFVARPTIEETTPPANPSRVAAALSAPKLDLPSLKASIAGTFRDEVRREVSRGFVSPADAHTSLPLILREIPRRARLLFESLVLVDTEIADLRSVLLPAATLPILERAQRDLEERTGVDRILALSSAVGALEMLERTPAVSEEIRTAYRGASKTASRLIEVLGEVIHLRRVAASRPMAASDVAWWGARAAVIAPLSVGARRAIGLLSLSPPLPGTLLEAVRATPVEAAAATKAAAAQLLSSCAAEGFDSVLRDLESGYPVSLLAGGFLSATRVGQIAEVAGDLTYKNR